MFDFSYLETNETTTKRLSFVRMANSFGIKSTTISTHLSIDMENVRCAVLCSAGVSVYNELNFPIENQLTFKTIQFDSVMIDIN